MNDCTKVDESDWRSDASNSCRHYETDEIWRKTLTLTADQRLLLASGFRPANLLTGVVVCDRANAAAAENSAPPGQKGRYTTNFASWIPKISRIDSESYGEPDFVVFEMHVDVGAARKGS